MNIVICFALIMLTTSLNTSAGMILRIHKNKIVRLVGLLLPTINKKIESFDYLLPVDPADRIQIKNISAQITPIKENQIGLVTSTSTDYFDIKILNIEFNLNIGANINVPLMSGPHFITASGTIDEMIIRVSFIPFDKLTFKEKPFVRLSSESININRAKIIIKFKEEGILTRGLNSLISSTSSFILDKVESEVKKNFPTKITDEVNDNIRSEYPTNIDLKSYKLMLATGLVTMPKIDDENIVLEIDGTIYDSSVGFKTSNDNLTVNRSRRPNFDMDIGITNRPIRTLLEALHNKQIDLKVSDYAVKIAPFQNQFDFDINKQGVNFKNLAFNLEINSKELTLKSDIKATCLGNLMILKNHGNWLIHLNVIKLEMPFAFSMTGFGFKTARKPGFSINADTNNAYENTFIMDFPKIPLPFGINLEDLGIDYEDKYIVMSIQLGKNINQKTII